LPEPAIVPVTLIVSGLASVRVPVIAEPVTVPLSVPVVEQEPVSPMLAEKAPMVWVKVPETVAEPLVEET
jgi:hypothetical protein